MKVRRQLFVWSLSSLLCLGGACTNDPTEVDDKGDSPTQAPKDAGAKDGAVKRDANVADPTDDSEEDDNGDGTAQSRDGGKTPASDAGKPKGDAAASTPEAGSQVPAADAGTAGRFSFFVTSLEAIRKLSGSQNGFGGDLRFGETGEGAGLRGADKICTTIAEESMPGSGTKVWRAFLSATKGADGDVVNAIDRIGEGPWYDRRGRLVSTNKTDILMVRPGSADATIKNDLPNEDGVPNHDPDGTGQVDNHDILTGTNDKGQLYKNDVKVTCNDWTKSQGDSADAPRVGHAWPRSGPGGGGGRPGGGRPDAGGSTFSTENWMSALDEAGCGAGVSIVEMGPPMESTPTVGSGGGYGGIYCFALTP
ncbi:MAG: hypothetical protein RLZZ450_3081 [Pseudomonadota bacterium]|jgi:hypothetical protein